LVDSAESTAKAVAEAILGRMAPGSQSTPEVHFFATDSVEKFRRNGEKFLGCTIANVQHVEIE
jgi:glutamate racemase